VPAKLRRPYDNYKRAILGLIVGSVLLATGCGGGSSPRPTVAGLAAKLDQAGVACTDVRMNPDVLIAREEGSCGSGANLVTIDVFNNNQARDSARKIAEGFGAKLVMGDRWGVTVESDAGARNVQRALGGTMA